MSRIGVVTDSHSGIFQEKAKELGILVLPMPFYINDACYYESLNLTREAFYTELQNGAKVTTSQPSPADVLALWNQALEAYDQILYMPISSGLSGSYATAAALSEEEPYAGRVFVIDTGRVATPLHVYVRDALDLIQRGYDAPTIVSMLDRVKEQMVIYVTVDNLEYLKRGGRISPTTASVGTLLNIKPVLKFDVGQLDVFTKCRGFQKAKKAMIEAMRNDLNTVFREAYEKGRVHLLAATSASEEVTAQWVAEIKEAFPDLPVLCEDLSFGVSCHIGPGGLGIGCSCMPFEK